MSVLVSVPLEGGGSIVMEAPEELTPVGVTRASRPGEVVKEAGETLEEALDNTLVPVTQAVMARLKDMGPEGVEISLGLKLSAEAGVVISKVAGEASLVVKLTWKKDGASAS
jgi:Trypsin-co-occurring domain 1